MGSHAQYNVSKRHQQRAGNDRRTVAEQAVGQPAAENRGNVNQRRVGAEECNGMAVIKAKLVGEVEDEEGTHAIKAEIFPDLDRYDVINRARL